MEKLIKLAELAKKAAPGEWHQEAAAGSPWNIVDKDGVQVALMQQRTPIKDNPKQTDRTANAAFIAAANPAAILAIAEEFKALEHSLKDANVCVEASKQEIADLEQRAEAAEAKLAELEKQEPVACKQRLVNHRSGQEHHWTYHGEVAEASQGDIFRVEVVPLFERPAPSVSLEELVPGEMSFAAAMGAVDDPVEVSAEVRGWNACRAAILRNIEESK